MWDAAVETFGQWLREQVWSRQWGATDLAREISALDPNEKPLSKSAVSEWMNGNRIPRPVQCIKIAKALGIEPRIVLEKAGRVDEAPAEREPLHFPIPAVDPFLVNLRLIPLMDVTVHAGQVHYLATETIPVDSRITGDLVGVRVEGDCLTPQIEPGDVVVVDNGQEVKNQNSSNSWGDHPTLQVFGSGGLVAEFLRADVSGYWLEEASNETTDDPDNLHGSSNRPRQSGRQPGYLR